MAKLSAYGQREFLRMAKEYYPECKDDTRNEVVWRKKTVAFMTNNRILVKEQARWADGMKHDWGWKVKGKLKSGVTPEQIKSAYEKLGYQQVAR